MKIDFRGTKERLLSIYQTMMASGVVAGRVILVRSRVRIPARAKPVSHHITVFNIERPVGFFHLLTHRATYLRLATMTSLKQKTIIILFVSFILAFIMFGIMKNRAKAYMIDNNDPAVVSFSTPTRVPKNIEMNAINTTDNSTDDENESGEHEEDLQATIPLFLRRIVRPTQDIGYPAPVEPYPAPDVSYPVP